LVVRVTNRDIITQIVAADLTHDVVLAAAYSHELPRYGIKLGLTNYAAAYATGLLLARRINAKFSLSYEGQKKVDGEEYNVEASEEEGAAKPFKALLDVGLARTTSGARVFGVLKGATDGGIDVPHNDHRYPGSKREGTEWTTSAETHRKYIFGGHIADYMKSLQEENEEAYNTQFKRYIEQNVSPANFEQIYTKAHAAIRADPNKKVRQAATHAQRTQRTAIWNEMRQHAIVDFCWLHPAFIFDHSPFLLLSVCLLISVSSPAC
jgi:large subunit ribosomal protein L5e